MKVPALLMILLLLLLSGPARAGSEEDLEEMGFEEVRPIPDPLEPLNRVFFTINDRFYFHILKPVAQGYRKVVPKGIRVSVRRFFTNVTTPVRFVNSLLQFKFDTAFRELERFFINTTIGFLGFTDPARDRFGLFLTEEDLGQTIGFYGAGPGLYINWPILGPSSLRDTVGMIGDFFLDPVNYLFPHDRWALAGVRAYELVNETSLEIGTYESLKKGAVDPYVAVRDAYHQHRESLVEE